MYRLTNFIGYLDLRSLPPSITELWSQENSFHGGLILTCLPNSLKFLALSKNRFEGDVNLDHLPKKMGYLNLSDNVNLCGMYRAWLLPTAMYDRYWTEWCSCTYAMHSFIFSSTLIEEDA